MFIERCFGARRVTSRWSGRFREKRTARRARLRLEPDGGARDRPEPPHRVGFAERQGDEHPGVEVAGGLSGCLGVE
jgi:hypothetical protein